MTRTELKKAFPNCSLEFLQQNASDAPTPCSPKKRATAAPQAQRMGTDMTIANSERTTIHLTIEGNVVGGKNNIIICRNGARIPKQSWVTWRDQKVAEVKAQLPPDWIPIATPASVRMDYVAGDKRRRDQPAVIDSLWHVLEKAGVAVDDTLLWVNHSSRDYSKEHPKTTLWITW